jgi:hypothetical protein
MGTSGTGEWDGVGVGGREGRRGRGWASERGQLPVSERQAG